MKLYLYLSLFIFIFLTSLTQARVREIRIEGNSLVSDSAVQAQLKSRVGQSYRKSNVIEDVKILFNLGYFNNIYVDLKKTSKGEILTYHVEEKRRINTITYKGSQVLSKKKLEELSQLKKYEFLNIQKLKTGITEIKNALKEKGYFLSDVEYEVKNLEKDQVDLIVSIKEGKKILIKGVSIIGNKNIKSRRIKRFLASKEKNILSFLTSGAVYSEEKIKRDQQVIRYLYLEEGFLEMNLIDTVLTLAPDQSGLYISFTVQEGEKFKVGQIDFKGDLLFSKVELRENQGLKTGDTFVYSKLQNDLTRLRTLYGDKGYAYANVVPQFRTQEGDTIHVLFSIEKGDPVYLRHIDISGNDHTRDKVIRRMIPLSEGDLYNATEILRSKASIQRLGYFEEVKFLNQSVIGEDDQIDLLVSIRERDKLGEFSLGGGYSSSMGFSVQGRLNQENLLGYGTSVGVQGTLLFQPRQEDFFGPFFFDASYIDPYFLDSDWYFGLKFSAYYRGYVDRFFEILRIQNDTGGSENQNLLVPFQVTDEVKYSEFYDFNRSDYLNYISYYRFYTERIGGKFSFGKIFQNKIKVLSHFGLEDIRFTHSIDPTIFNGEEAGGLRSTIGGSVDYDFRDDRFFPRNGLATNMNLEYTYQNKEDESSLKFTQFDIWGSYYFDLQRFFSIFSNQFFNWDFLKEVVIKNKIQYGKLHLLSDEGSIPFDKLYLLGGPTSLRGFSMNSVGEKRESSRLRVKNPDSTLSPVFIPYGGVEQLFYNLELKFPLVKEAKVFGILFFDMGYADDMILSELFNLSKFRKNVGFGLFLVTPLGPMNVKWGIPFNAREEYGESLYEFQFNMGYDF